MEPSKIHSKKRVVQPNCKKNKLGYNYNLQKMVIEGTHMVIEPSKNGWFLHVFAEYEWEYDWKFSGLPAKVASFMWLEQAFPATG